MASWPFHQVVTPMAAAWAEEHGLPARRGQREGHEGQTARILPRQTTVTNRRHVMLQPAMLFDSTTPAPAPHRGRRTRLGDLTQCGMVHVQARHSWSQTGASSKAAEGVRTGGAWKPSSAAFGIDGCACPVHVPWPGGRGQPPPPDGQGSRQGSARGMRLVLGCARARAATVAGRTHGGSQQGSAAGRGREAAYVQGSSRRQRRRPPCLAWAGGPLWRLAASQGHFGGWHG